MSGHEIELKLSLDPASLTRLERHPVIRSHSQGRAATRSLASTYWDTPDFALARAGITVRVRTQGRRRIQTVKTAGHRAAGLFARREWETIIDGDRPDCALLRSTGVPELDDPPPLVPVFTTAIRRTTRLLAGPGWQVELAIDAGSVGTADRTEPIHEAELELREGCPADLFALAETIAAAVPVRLTALSKSDRGYALARGNVPGPVKARPVAVSAAMPVTEAFEAIARNCLDHLLANEAVLLATRDGEAIHQMRVALRRLRSAMKVFRPVVAGPGLDEMRGHLRWLLDHLGPARDGDVFLSEIVDPVVERYPGNPALAGLRHQWLALRDDGIAAAVDAVADRRFTAMLLALGAWIEAGDWRSAERTDAGMPLGPFAARVLAKRDRRLRKAGGKDLTPLAPEQLHGVRILGKQLRYAGEFFAPLYPTKATRTFLSTVADLQDALGQLNDITVAAPKLEADSWAAGVVAGWHEARRPALLEAAQGAWKRFRKAERVWSKRS